MAVYEYRCRECDHTFVVSETISRHEEKKSNPKCPKCGSRKTRQLFSSFFAKTASKS